MTHHHDLFYITVKYHDYIPKGIQVTELIGICIKKASKGRYRIYPKYSDTVNVRTRYFFLKRHLFYVPYISGHVPNRVFLLSVNVRTQKTRPLFLIKILFFTVYLLCLPVFPVSVIDKPLCPVASTKIYCTVAV